MSRKIGMNSFPDGTRVAAFAIAVALTSACTRQDTVRKTSPPVAAEPTPNTPPAAGGPTRVEKDLLGEKQVPADAYYGVQTERALENFRISDSTMNTYPEFIDAFVMVKLAAARANAKLGALKKDRLAAIEKACQAVLEGKYR